MELLLKTNGKRGRTYHARVMDSAVAVVRRWFLVTIQNSLRPRTPTVDISSDFEVGFSYLQFSCLLNSTTNENECGVTWKMFLDKYGEPFCYSLSLYRVCARRSIPSNWQNARLLLMKPRAQQMNEKHTAVTVEMYVLCCAARGRWGKQHNRQMTGVNLTLSWFVQGVSGHENPIWILLMRIPVLSVKFVCVILFPCCMYVCMYVCLFINVSSTKPME
jgi:hypothetical protein